jgi:F-type H+-transporting ATPase subunit epsilon
MSPASSGRLSLRVIAPREVLVQAEVLEVSLPSLDGQVGILPGHRPMVLALGRGPLTFRSEAHEGSFNVRGGYAEVGPEAVLAFTELSEEEDEAVSS